MQEEEADKEEESKKDERLARIYPDCAHMRTIHTQTHTHHFHNNNTYAII